MHEPDVMNHDIGDQLAVGRALKDLGALFIKRGYKQVHALDRTRTLQRKAAIKGQEAKRRATEIFEQEFATLIEELHPGTFTKPSKIEFPVTDWRFNNGVWKAAVGDGSIDVEIFEDEAEDLFAAMQAKYGRDNLPA